MSLYGIITIIAGIILAILGNKFGKSIVTNDFISGVFGVGAVAFLAYGAFSAASSHDPITLQTYLSFALVGLSAGLCSSHGSDQG